MEAINHIWEREEELSDVVCSGTMASEIFQKKKIIATMDLGENFKPNQSPINQLYQKMQ